MGQFSSDEVGDGDEVSLRAVATRPGLGGLDEAVDGLDVNQTGFTGEVGVCHSAAILAVRSAL